MPAHDIPQESHVCGNPMVRPIVLFVISSFVPQWCVDWAREGVVVEEPPKGGGSLERPAQS